jgi:hypothetical protein
MTDDPRSRCERVSTWGLVRAAMSVYHRYLNTETERDGGALCFYVKETRTMDKVQISSSGR